MTSKSSASSPPAARNVAKDAATKKVDPKWVRYDEIPPLTNAQRKRLGALARRPDSEIDFSDIPPTTDEDFARAIPNPFYRPRKAQLTVRLDADVVAWLRSGGRGYQTRINAILREAMSKAARKKVNEAA